jgi:Fur family ferric uptake transcriptional regulator
LRVTIPFRNSAEALHGTQRGNDTCRAKSIWKHSATRRACALPSSAASSSEADDHPDVEKVYERASQIDPGISIATVYRTVRLFEEAGILDRHDFGDGRARYEPAPEAHHDHLIDVESGKVIEFVDPELEQLQKAIAEKLGFRLVDHRMELYGVALTRKD